MPAELLYPQLYDQEWMQSQLHVSNNKLGKELGCTPDYVSQRRRTMGMRSTAVRGNLWAEWEDDLVRLLYRRVPTKWLAEEMRRTRDAICRRTIRRKMLRPPNARNWQASPRNHGLFWRRWRAAIRVLLRAWPEDEDLREVQHLAWRPAREISTFGCGLRRMESGYGSLCPRYDYCKAHRAGPFACERVSVGELLGWMNGGRESSDRTRAG